MTEAAGDSLDDARGARIELDSSWARLLLAAEHAVDIGARTLRRGRSHIGALIGKGDRDFATDVDLRIESEIKVSLAEATPEVPLLGEEEDDAGQLKGARWVLDPIDGTIKLRQGQPAVLDLPVARDRRTAGAGDRRSAAAGRAIHRPPR